MAGIKRFFHPVDINNKSKKNPEEMVDKLVARIEKRVEEEMKIIGPRMIKQMKAEELPDDLIYEAIQKAATKTKLALIEALDEKFSELKKTPKFDNTPLPRSQ